MKISEIWTQIQNVIKEYDMPNGWIINQDRWFFIDNRSYEDAGFLLEQYVSAISEIKDLYIDNKNVFSKSDQLLIDESFIFLELEIDLFRKSFDIEAEKNGLIKLSDDARKQYNEWVKDIESKMYGPPISSNDKEVYYILAALQKKFRQWSHLITSDQSHVFWKIIDGFEPINSSHKETEWSKIEEWKKVPLETVKIVLKLVFEFYAVENKNIAKREVKYWAYGNLSVDRSKRLVKLPVNGITLKRLLELIAHEFEQHGLQWESTMNNIWMAVWDYLTWEEGVALLHEQTVSREIDDLDYTPTIHHITTYLWELYMWEELLEMLKVYFILEWYDEATAQSQATSRYKRIKRFHSEEIFWSNRKDVTYWRWFLQVVDMISKNWIRNAELNNLYWGKIPLEIKLSANFSADVTSIVAPHWIWRYLYRKLYGIDQGTTVLNLKAITYSQKKMLYKIFKKLEEYK